MDIIIQFMAKLTHYFSTFNFLDLIIVLVVIFYLGKGIT